MSNNTTSLVPYEKLIQSVSTFTSVGESIQRDKSAMNAFADIVNKDEARIDKFEKASSQVGAYLDSFAFEKGFRFDDMSGKIGNLVTLFAKITAMIEEAKKLSVHPDRYDSHKAIEVCKAFALKCKGALKIEEAGSAIALAENNTKKLAGIRAMFEDDSLILQQIQKLMQEKAVLLDKYRAYQADLRQYVDAFPHSGKDDLEEVNKAVGALVQIDGFRNQVKKNVDTIVKYADRYNKGSVVADFGSLENEMATRMRIADVSHIKQRLKNIDDRVQGVRSAFDNERETLQDIYDSLTRRSPDIWKENNEALIDNIDGLLESELCTKPFNLSEIQNSIGIFKQNRRSDIQKALNENPWLNNNKHRSFHNDLVNTYMFRSDYYYRINNAKKQRTKTILKWVGIAAGIIAGVVVVITTEIGKVIMGILIVWGIIKVIANKN